MVQWYDASLPRTRPGFDSRLVHSFLPKLHKSMPHPLLGFVVGSSILATLPFLLTVARLPPAVMNYTYRDYSLAAPLYLGAMSALAVWLAGAPLGLGSPSGGRVGLRAAMLAVSIVSPLIVVALAWTVSSYNFDTPSQWAAYAARLTLKHMAVYNLVVLPLILALQ